MHPGARHNHAATKRSVDDALYALVFCAGVILSILAMPLGAAALSAAWWAVVLIIVKSDLATFTIPDEATIAVLALGLIDVWLHPSGRSFISDAMSALSSGVAAFCVFYCVKQAYVVLRGQDGLGFGDVKLAGACAVWINSHDQIIALEIATVSALVLTLIKQRWSPAALIPYGAFLAPAAWVVFVGGSWFDAK